MPLLNVHALAGALLVQPPLLTVLIEARSSRCLLRGAVPLAPRIGAALGLKTRRRRPGGVQGRRGAASVASVAG